MRIAYYAPLKSPHHPVPSGDRKVARLFMAALTQAGHEVELASEMRTWSANPDADRRAALMGQSLVEADRLIARWRAAPQQAPELWFTYHPYYKAPDWIGPRVARAMAIPYVTAEASHAGKRDRDDWADWQAPVTDALRLAALNICMTPVDREALLALVGEDRVATLHPFVDVEGTATVAAALFPPDFKLARPLLITVAMMRPGDKLHSYEMLARVLASLTGLTWSLAIIGDGTMRPAVERAFAAVPRQRIAWCGEAPADQVADFLGSGDIYVWPGFGEAYGLAYLEAQLAGLPVVAQRTGGIASVVEDGRTGILTPPGDDGAYAGALAELIGDGDRRRALGSAARAFVRNERALPSAARALDAMLQAAQRNKAKRA